MLPVPGDDSDVYMNTAEVAEALGCTRTHVSVLRSRARKGDENGNEAAPAWFRFGRTLYTRRSSVARFMENLERTNNG